MATVRPATLGDLEAVYTRLAVRSRAVLGTADVNLDQLRADWTLPSFEVGRDNWVGAEDGRVVGYAALGSSEQFVHAAEDAATGDDLLRRVEARARERRFDHVGVTVTGGDVAPSELVRRSGFVLDREIIRMSSTSPTSARHLYERGGFVVDRRHELWTKRL